MNDVTIKLEYSLGGIGSMWLIKIGRKWNNYENSSEHYDNHHIINDICFDVIYKPIK